MNRPHILWLPSLLLAVLLPAAADAWNKAGHMVTGAIAYQTLKEAGDDKTIPRVVALLRQHPQFASWKNALENLPEADRDIYLFMKAARWPDDARGDPVYYPPDAQHDKLHYINIPYKPANQPDSVKTKAPDDLNIFRGYADKLAVLKSKASDADRAVALCWIAHLVGDVHQPLHTTSLFSTQFKSGDRGGTLFLIRAAENRASISLHKYWDDLLLSSDGFQNVRNLATLLRNRKEFAPDQLTELATTNFQDWAVKESFEIAKRSVYLDGKLEGSAQKNQALVLPADYAKTVQPIAERRAALAGRRLAAILRQALE